MNKKIPAAIFLFFIIFYLLKYKSLPIQYWDENFWIGRGFYIELFLKGDFKNSLWDNFTSFDQPKLAEYFYGLIIYPSYLKEKQTRNDPDYDYIKYLIDQNFYTFEGGEGTFKYYTYKNKGADFIPIYWHGERSPELLVKEYGEEITKAVSLIYKARLGSVFILALSAVTIFFVGFKLSKNYLVSSFSALFYGLSTIIVRNGLLAHSEALFSFFFNLGIYLALDILRSKGNILKKIILASIIAGLCMSTKLNGAILVLFLIVTLFIKLFQNKQKKVLYIRYMLIIPFICLTTFQILNPFTYKNPIGRTIELYEHRYFTSRKAQMWYPSSALVSFSGRISKIYTSFFSTDDNTYPYTKIVTIPKNSLPTKLMLSFFLIGIFSLLIYKVLKNIDWGIIAFFLFFLLQQIAMGFYLLLSWEHYFFPLVTFFAIIEAYGVYQIMIFSKQAINKKLL